MLRTLLIFLVLALFAVPAQAKTITVTAEFTFFQSDGEGGGGGFIPQKVHVFGNEITASATGHTFFCKGEFKEFPLKKDGNKYTSVVECDEGRYTETFSLPRSGNT